LSEAIILQWTMFVAKLLFAIPAFNEAATISEVIRSLLPHGDVLVVDDGSYDETNDIARSSGAKVVRHPTNLGYDAAIYTGLTEGRLSSYDWILTLDADGQHYISDLVSFSAHFADMDLIIGVRPSDSRRFGERLLALNYRIKHGLHDPLSGFKAYRTQSLRKIQVRIDQLKPSYGLDVLDAILYTNPRIAQVPILIRKRQDTARVGNSWNVNWRMLCCLWERLI